MELTVISQSFFFDGEIAILKQILELEIASVHIRKPNALANDIEIFLKGFNEIEKEKMVMHYHFETAQSNGVFKHHQSTHAVPNVVFSKSVHTLDEIDNTLNYNMISPVFDSISKQDYLANFDWEAWKIYRTKHKQSRVVALGGVDLMNINRLMEEGFDGAAVLGAIWLDKDPVNKCKKLLELC